jgi:ferric-dicitrate binding protein FerR (iron transport regulator)
MICPKKHEEGVECPDCRALARVWERLDEFAAPEVTPGFDARLYARIAAEEKRRASGWRRWGWRPLVPLAAAAAVAAVVLWVHPSGSPDAAKQAGKADIEQVAQAVDDLDLLIPLADTNR